MEQYDSVDAGSRPSQRLLQVVTIPESDPRAGLRGALGCFARTQLQPGWVLDRYDAWIGPLSEWVSYRSTIPEGDAAADSIFPESYGVRLTSKGVGGTELIACAKGRHCFAHRINDKRHDPLGHPGSHALDKEPNCQFAEVVDHKGKLHLFVVCTKTIAPGEELLLDYGSPYWEAHRDVIADLLHGVANVFNQMSNQFTTKPLTKVPKSKL
eukprot:TRINITY_DN30680_c0_g1_i2.p1 TRINITY_DN30680_c0_g1~~TRINITY_DN30680_c0_g1_i2.p1  ORF type:complete len:211 (-),score=12.70 TRINITY_DN30680_c0_g1_i2:230-862(-)